MKKDLDWNSAIIGNEDWNAASDSEVFINYANIMLAKENKKNKQIKEAQKAAKEVEEYMKDVPNPLRSNFDYGAGELEDSDEIESIDNSFGTEVDSSYIDDDYNIDNITNSIESEAMRLYDENTKQAQIENAEKSLGLHNNIYYQLLKAEKGIK